LPTDRIRDIRNSLHRRVELLLSNPEPATGVSPYTVYGEEDLLRVQKGTLTPSRPCVFLVSRPVRPVMTSLPLVALETTVRAQSYELGNTKGRMFLAQLHCFGRQKSEATFLAGYLQENLRPVIIYDFTTPDHLIEKERALLADAVDVDQGPIVDDALRKQGAFDNWFIVRARGWTRDV